MALFRMGEATQVEGESGRWGRALLFTALLHAGLLLGGLSMQGALAKEAPPREEPEVVFFSFPPPPAAASSGTASRAVAPERVKRQARTRPPRSLTELRAPTPLPALAPVEPEPPSEAVVTEESPAVEGGSAGVSGVGGVIGGIVGGVLDGRQGGLVGATGGEALELKQVAQAPRVLEQVRPRYPQRAKADRLVGLVVVRVIIGIDGRIEPENTRVLRSVAGLDAAAIAAVHQWRFSPALGHQGRPVRVIVEIPLQFSLK